MIADLKPYGEYKASGLPWLGLVPGHWEVQRLKNWVTINRHTLGEDTPADFEFDYLDIGAVATGRLAKRPARLRFVDAPSRVLSLRRVHRSRNPRLVRVLVDIGVARDQGEGIPRMFAEMEDAFLPRPEIEASPRNVSVTLRNTPTLTTADREFVARLGSTDVSDEEFRALLHAHRQQRVENADMRSIAGLDTLESSILLRRLRDRSLLELHPHGAHSYYTLPPILQGSADQKASPLDRGELEPDRGELAADRGAQEPDRGELPPTAQAAIADLGQRARKQRLRTVIEMLCGLHDWTTPAELSRWLNFRSGNLSERHLSPMVDAGQLERRYPHNLSHPEQAYRAIRRQDELRFTPGDTP